MSAKDDARFQHIAKMVAAQLSTPELPVTAAMVDKGSNATWVQEFMGAGAEGVEPRMAHNTALDPEAEYLMPSESGTTANDDGKEERAGR